MIFPHKSMRPIVVCIDYCTRKYARQITIAQHDLQAAETGLFNWLLSHNHAIFLEEGKHEFNAL